MDAVRKNSFIIVRKADGMEMGRLKDGDTMEDDRPPGPARGRVKAESDEEKEDVERKVSSSFDPSNRKLLWVFR